MKTYHNPVEFRIHNEARQTITTKFLPPTNYRNSRVKATAQAGSVTIDFDHALSIRGAHDKAAAALMAKLEWDEYASLIGGGYNSGYHYVLVPHEMLDEQPSQHWIATLTDTLNNEVIAERYHVGTLAEAVNYFESQEILKKHVGNARYRVIVRATTEVELFSEGE